MKLSDFVRIISLQNTENCAKICQGMAEIIWCIRYIFSSMEALTHNIAIDQCYSSSLCLLIRECDINTGITSSSNQVACILGHPVYVMQ